MLLFQGFLKSQNVGFKKFDFSLARFQVHLSIREILVILLNLVLQSVKFVHIVLDLRIQIFDNAVQLVILGFLSICVLDFLWQIFLHTIFVLTFESCHPSLMFSQLLLIFSLVFPVIVHLSFDLSAHFVVGVVISLPLLFFRIYFIVDLFHLTLEILLQCQSFLFLLV